MSGASLVRGIAVGIVGFDLVGEWEETLRDMRPSQNSGLSVRELIVALVVAAVLLVVVLPEVLCGCAPALTRAQMTQTLSNMKQLQGATQEMAFDGQARGETNLRWPGDSGGSFTNWAQQLVPAYLSTNDLCKLLSVAGRITPKEALPAANTNGTLVYAASQDSRTNTVFLASANVMVSPAGPVLDAKGVFGGKGFVVFHQAGDGEILLPRQITNTDLVGTFPQLCR